MRRSTAQQDNRPISSNANAASGTQPKWWVLVSDQDKCVGNDPVVPADNALDEMEHSPGIVPSEQDGEPCDDHRHDRCDIEKREHDEVGNGQKPLDERKPAVEFA